jgi:pilus assembly protein Flp/PilA
MDWYPLSGGDSYLDGFLMKNFLQCLLLDEDGPTAVEYAVMLALIVITCIGSVGLLSSATGDSFNNSAAEINSALGS